MARKPKEEFTSQSIRVGSEIARMVSWICEIEGITSVELIDPLIRPAILARFERMKKEVAEIERMQEKLKEKMHKKAEGT